MYKKLVAEGKIIVKEEVDPPKVPMDYDWARVSSLALINYKCTLSAVPRVLP